MADDETRIIRATPTTLLSGVTERRHRDGETILWGPVSPKLPPIGSAPAPLPPGFCLRGRYDIIKTIARGGFSYVYLCHHRNNGRLFAVKEAFSDQADRLPDLTVVDHDLARQVLLQESSLIAQVNSPFVVKLREIFEENGTLYMVTEFIEGESAQNLLNRRGKLSFDTFESMVTQFFEAIRHLNDADVCHGDLKPQNVMLRPDRSLALIDFGSGWRLTDGQDGVATFTPCYSSPESQFERSAVGPRSEVYSAAATIAYLLAGASPPDVGERQHDETAMTQFLSKIRNRYPSNGVWVDAVQRAMQMDQNARYADMEEFAAATGFQFNHNSARDKPSDGSSVFICYSHTDERRVTELVGALQRGGVSPWIDRVGIQPGSRAWGREIVGAMRDARLVLIFSSSHSMRSQNVINEIYLARELAKPISVVRLDDFPFPDEVMLFLIKSQHIDARRINPGMFVDQVLAILNET